MLGNVQHGGGVDHLAAHLFGGVVHRGDSGAVGVGAVDHAAVHAALGDLGGDLLHVGAVGDLAGVCQFLFIQAIIGQNLLGVLAHRHVAVAHGHQNVAAFQRLGQIVKAGDGCIAALGYAQGNLVFQQVHSGALGHEVQPFGVHAGVSGLVQLIHLLLPGGEEQVADRALLNLGFQGAGGIEVEGQGHIGGYGLVVLGDLVQGLGQAGGGKHRQLHRFAPGLGLRSGSGRRAGTGGRGRRGGSGGGCAAATACQRERQREGCGQCECLFHG